MEAIAFQLMVKLRYLFCMLLIIQVSGIPISRRGEYERHHKSLEENAFNKQNKNHVRSQNYRALKEMQPASSKMTTVDASGVASAFSKCLDICLHHGSRGGTKYRLAVWKSKSLSRNSPFVLQNSTSFDDSEGDNNEADQDNAVGDERTTRSYTVSASHSHFCYRSCFSLAAFNHLFGK